jgi:hypothetical protein
MREMCAIFFCERTGRGGGGNVHEGGYNFNYLQLKYCGTIGLYVLIHSTTFLHEIARMYWRL